MCQAQIVQTRLEERFPGQTFTLKTIKAQADKNPELPLVAMGGEGVFVKELEAALRDRRIDCAVHSMKDLPLETPPDLRIAAVLEREDPRDALVSRTGESFDRLPAGARTPVRKACFLAAPPKAGADARVIRPAPAGQA